jgi:DNA-binding IclR family transcriptional regulator
MAAADASKVRSVQHALDVLEQIAFAGEELGVTQLAERLGLTKASVHRHLVTLVERGYLAQNPVTARYGIGPKCRLLMRAGGGPDLLRAADDPMRELRDELGHTVVLSSMSPRGALVMATAASASAIEIGVRPGSELSFHASAQGRVLLAYAPARLRARVLAGPLERFTARTETDPRQIEGLLAGIAEAGFAAAPERVLLGINAVAAPVFDADDACVASVAVVGSIQHLPDDPPPALVAALMRTAAQISRRLGQRPRGEAETRRRTTLEPA